MLNQELFGKLVDEIVRKGFDEKTAAHFAALIGDTPVVDADGRILAMEDGKVLARLYLEFFSTK